jgi:hypothetical protein
LQVTARLELRMKKCPKCHQSRKVHRSHRDAALWLQLLGWHRFRCTECNLYFEGWKLFPTRRNGGSSSKESDESQSKPEPKIESKPQPKPAVEIPKKAVSHDDNNGGESASNANEGFCLHCQSQRIRRAKREGLMEHVFYPLVSKYPYKCSECGTRFMKKGRG